MSLTEKQIKDTAIVIKHLEEMKEALRQTLHAENTSMQAFEDARNVVINFDTSHIRIKDKVCDICKKNLFDPLIASSGKAKWQVCQDCFNNHFDEGMLIRRS